MKKLFAVLGTFCMALGLMVFGAPQEKAYASAGSDCHMDALDLGTLVPNGMIFQASINNWKYSAGTCWNRPGWVSSTQEYAIRSSITSSSSVNENYIIYLEEYVGDTWVARAHTGSNAWGEPLTTNSGKWDMINFTYDYNHYGLNKDKIYRMRFSDPGAVAYRSTSFRTHDYLGFRDPWTTSG